MTAEEGVTVEAARIERKPHRRLDDELSDVECRSIGPDSREPTLYLLRVRAPDRHSIERVNAVLEDDPFTPGEPACREGFMARAELERMDLAEMFVDGCVAPDLQLEAADWGPEDEPAPVDRRGAGAYASAFRLIASNSAWSIAPLSSSAFARSISAAAPPPLPAVERT